MDRKDYLNMLEGKEDEWMGVLEQRRAQLEQEDIATQVSDCEIKREMIHGLEEKLADLRSKREALSESDEAEWENLKRDMDKKVEEFKCDFDEIVYFDDENPEPKE